MSPPHLTPLTRQVLAGIITHHAFTHPPTPSFPGFTADSLLSILSSLPSLLLLSPRSLGRQTSSSSSLRHRHRSPLKPRVPPPPKYTQIERNHGVSKALEFYSWAETSCGFPHTPLTCRAMARLLAQSPASSFRLLFLFLRRNRSLLTTPALTDVIKILGRRGSYAHALNLFHRMKQLHCRPDAQCQNTLIAALCRAGRFERARFLLSQMELPGSRCPPDTYTYTILVDAYCKHGMQTGCRKAVRRRIWEANHMFRHMVFKGFEPDVVTYNCLIDGLCKTYRIDRARELFDEMLLKEKCVPNRVTYNSFVRYYSVVNEADKAVEMMRLMVSKGHGVATCSSYTPIIHSLCESGRVKEARDLMAEMVVEGGSIPREFTYRLVSDALKSTREEGLSTELRARIESAMHERCRRVMQLKPVLRAGNRFSVQQEKA